MLTRMAKTSSIPKKRVAVAGPPAIASALATSSRQAMGRSSRERLVDERFILDVVVVAFIPEAPIASGCLACIG
jgi:hypothetical protein